MRFASIATIFVCCLADLASSQEIVPNEFARVHRFSEGPVIDHSGNLYISHRPFITKIAPSGETSTWAELESPNGHKVLADGTHLVCNGAAGVVHLNADGERLSSAATTCGSAPARRPNDLTLDHSGGFYFTDPGTSPFEDEGYVCYVNAAGESVLAAGGVEMPNGIAITADGDSVYVAETRTNRIVKFPVLRPGVLGPKMVFAELPEGDGDGVVGPDGIALDADGNLYVAHFGTGFVRVLSEDGRLVRSLAAGHKSASNVAFGGVDLSTLYVTGAESINEGDGAVYGLDLPNTRGLAILPQRK